MFATGLETASLSLSGATAWEVLQELRPSGWCL